MKQDDDDDLTEFFRKRRHDEVMEGLLEVLNKPPVAQPASQVTMPTIEIPAPVVHVQAAPEPKPVLDWTFTFDRNKDGTIKSIRAKAT